MPRPPARRAIDPFTVGEPWRHFVQSAQRSRRQLTETIRATRPGPLRDRLQDIADRLDAGLQEGWEVAKRGNEIDGAIRALDPTRLRSRLDTLRAAVLGRAERGPRRRRGVRGEPAGHAPTG